MLMEIDPLPMRGSMVMTMVMIFPSWRDVSPAEQLRRSPRLVLPRFRLETEALRPENFLLIFLGKKTSYSRRWAPEACQGAHETGGTPRGVGHASLPRGFLEASLTSTPSLLDCFRFKNYSPEGFIPLGLRLIFLFFETLK